MSNNKQQKKDTCTVWLRNGPEKNDSNNGLDHLVKNNESQSMPTSTNKSHFKRQWSESYIENASAFMLKSQKTDFKTLYYMYSILKFI